MTDPQIAINASWERCERKYNLQRNTAQPILRLQSSEIAPRLEEVVERTGGKQGIFRKLAKVASDAGHCLVITDTDGILVRLESKDAKADWNGIALGSVWDEKIAGTNGVSMALSEGREFTVRGIDHFYSKLKPFACSAVPLRDANNKIIGVANLSSIDRGNPADYLFAKQLLGAAATRVQHLLFERAFKHQSIVSVAVPGRRELIKGTELVAVDSNGRIIGATSQTHDLVGYATHSALRGKYFDDVFETDISSLDKLPGRVLGIRRDRGSMLDLWIRTPLGHKQKFPGWRSKQRAVRTNKRLPPTFKELAVGSSKLMRLCEKACDCLDHSIPMLIEGETGSGKSAMVDALLGGDYRAVKIDCAKLEDNDEDRYYIRSLMEQIRISGTLEEDVSQPSALIFDNIDEMPRFAQAALRNVLDDANMGSLQNGQNLKIISIGRKSLKEAVQADKFRDDLYYMLSGAVIAIPPLRNREKPEVLAMACAQTLADHEVQLSTDACDIICGYDWPGNIRELRHALQQALIRGDGVKITALDLSLAPKPTNPPPRLSAISPVYDEKQLLLDALNGARWNVSKAARALEIGRATINRKMKMHGISRPTYIKLV